MNSPGWFRGPMAKMVMALSVGLAGGFGTFVVAHAPASARARRGRTNLERFRIRTLPVLHKSQRLRA